MHAVATSLLAYDGLLSVIENIRSKQSIPTWTISELHDVYVQAYSTLTIAQMLVKLAEHYGEELLLVSVNDYETEVGQKHNVGKTL